MTFGNNIMYSIYVGVSKSEEVYFMLVISEWVKRELKGKKGNNCHNKQLIYILYMGCVSYNEK